MRTWTISPSAPRGEELLRAKCPRCGFDLDPMRMARWRAFDRMAWCLGVSAMGFVGLIVVFVLVSLVLPNDFPCSTERCRSGTERDLRLIDSALEEYSADHSGRYPASLEALVVPNARGFAYLKGTRVPHDPWGNEYLYEPIGRVYTLGRDGAPGGEGYDADVDNLSLREDR